MRKLGIVHKVLLWLLLIVVVIGSTFAFGVASFGAFRERLEGVTQREIPDLIWVAELEQGTARLLELVSDLFLLREDYRFRNTQTRLDRALQQVMTTVDQLKRSDTDEARQLLETYQLLGEGITQLLLAKQREVELERRHQPIYLRLHRMQAEIDALQAAATSEVAAWYPTMVKVINHLRQPRDLTHPQQIEEERERLVAELQRLYQRLQQEEDALELWWFYQELYSYAFNSPSLFATHSELLHLRWQLARQSLELKQHFESLFMRLNGLNQEIRKAAADEVEGVAEQIERLGDLFFYTLLALLLLLAGVVLFVQWSVVRRLSMLHRDIEANLHNQKICERVYGDDELGRLAHDFNALIRMLRQREAALRVAAEQAEEGSRAKGAFVATISHEMRTPLNAILNLTRTCLQQPLAEGVRDRLLKVWHSSSFLLHLINQVLDFSRLDAGRFDLDREPFYLQELLAGLEMLAEEAQAKGLAWETRIDPQLPAVLVGDLLRIQQILNNLVANAIKFTEYGKVAVAMQQGGGDPQHCTVQFIVEDSGVGIPEEYLEVIFEPFHQGESGTTRRYGGSGLGLAICRRLVHRMGGELTAQRGTPTGSRFHFTLRLPQGAAHQPYLPISFKADSSLSAKQLAELSGKLVLVVEDNAFNQLVVLDLLEQAGIRSDQVESGRDALELAREESYELIIMDIQMPEMDGFATACALRARPQYRHVPIIAVTADTQIEQDERFLNAGMNGFISKPIVAKAFYQLLYNLLVKAPALPPGIGEETADPVASLSESLSDTQLQAEGFTSTLTTRSALLRGYLDHHSGSSLAIRRSLLAGDTLLARRLCHNLRAAAATIGAAYLAHCASRLEALLRSGATPPPEWLDALEQEGEAVEAAVRTRVEISA